LRFVNDTIAGNKLAEGNSLVESPACLPGVVSLRTILEHCLGLLSRVADGRVIEVSYGDAASTPVLVSEESVERILVNLVRNAASAMRRPGQRSSKEKGMAAQSTVLEKREDRTGDETPGAIRIGVGVMISRVQDAQPWPLRSVRLTVEDSGRGMTADQLERILSVTRAPTRGRHGIGFRVVCELVAASCGDLRVMSAPGIGTRVQIEWPVTAILQEKAAGKSCTMGSAAASNLMAPSSGLPSRERRGAQAQESMDANGLGMVLRPEHHCAARDGRGTIC